MKTSYLAGGLAAAVLTLGTAASATTLQITVTNNQAEGGLYLTPFLLAFHDGSVDFFDVGSPASSAIEALAEEGNPAGLIAQAGAFPTTVATAPGGFPGAPVLDPGESTTVSLNVDATVGRYLSFASMIIPSNDAFIGNDNPFAYQIFDAAGQFTRIGPITVSGDDVWDAGTEVNNNVGAAFNAAGGIGTDEGGVITREGDLSYLLGQNTVAGTSIFSVPDSRTDLLATIQIAAVPLPASLPLMAAALGLFGIARRRRTPEAAA